MSLALQVQGLTVHYDKRPALWDINLEIPKGKIVGIVGPNGAGKSTLIQTLLGLRSQVAGSIFFNGEPLKKSRGKIAYIPQKEAIDWDFPITVKELVLMGRYPKRGLFSFMKKEDQEAVDQALKLVGMFEYKERQIGELSGGQKQRVFLARALAQDAEVYFLDEPLSGVDHASEEIIMGLLRKMQTEGKTIFMVHHDLNSVENYFDWLILLNVRLIAQGAMSQVFTSKNLQEAYGKSFVLFNLKGLKNTV